AGAPWFPDRICLSVTNIPEAFGYLLIRPQRPRCVKKALAESEAGTRLTESNDCAGAFRLTQTGVRRNVWTGVRLRHPDFTSPHQDEHMFRTPLTRLFPKTFAPPL